MAFEFKKLENSQVEAIIKVEGAEVSKMKKDIIKKIAKEVELPGFRKGKAPESVVEEKFAEGIKEEMVEEILKQNYEKVIKETDTIPVDYPKVVEKKVEEELVEIKLIVDVYPEVKLGEYKGLEVEKESVEIKDEQVQVEIEELAKKNSKLKEVEEGVAAENGDIANIDFEGFVDGVAFDGGKADGHDLKLGSNSFIPGFEEQVEGHKAGEEFDVKVTFPEAYKEDLAGKEAIFKIKLNSIKRIEEVEIDDEFAKDAGFESLEELKMKKREELESNENAKIEQGFVNTILEKIKAGSELTIPKALIKKEMGYRLSEMEQQLKSQGATLDMYLQMQNMSKEQLAAELEPIAEEKVKMDIILAEITKNENVKLSDEELEEYIAEVAMHYQMEVEALKAELKKAGNYDSFIESIKMEKLTSKTVDMIVSETIVK